MRTLSGVIVAGLVLAVAGCNDDDDGGKDPAASSPPPSVSAPASASAQPTDSASAFAPTDDAPKPSASAATGSKTTVPTDVPPPPTTSGGGGTKSTQGAIARYEEFLHATGREDIDTMCEIAAPAAKKAEDEGTGPCQESFAVVVDHMISTQQKAALRTATIDPAGVTVVSPTQVEIPASAVQASVTFTSEDLGDMVLDYMNGNWYITD